MKKFSFLFFLVAMVGVTLSSSTCRTPPVDEEVIITDTTDTTGNNNPGTQENTGNARVAVQLYTIAGPPATTATVRLAYTFDSLNQEKFFKSLNTNDSGYAYFKDLPATRTGKMYYVYAEQEQGGDMLKSTNPGGPTKTSFELKTGQSVNFQTYVIEE